MSNEEETTTDKPVPNAVQIRAARRLKAIEDARKRIALKMEKNPHRVEDYKNRLAEYDESEPLLKIELVTGKPVRKKDPTVSAIVEAFKLGLPLPEPSPGVVVAPGAGQLNLDGKGVKSDGS